MTLQSVCRSLFKKAFGVGFDETPNPDEPGKLLLAIEQKDKLERLLTALDMRADGEVALHVNFGLLEEEPEQLAFFRGAFLAGGSVTDPAKRYHLELATPHLKVSARGVSRCCGRSAFRPRRRAVRATAFYISSRATRSRTF